MSRKLTVTAITWLTWIAFISGGCVEIAFLLSGASSTDTDGGGLFDTDGGNSSGGGNGGVLPTVRLTASNTSPTAQEEVLLACTLTSGDATGVTFAFSPNDGRLAVDPQRGTASFIVSETDVNQAFTFTCSATNEAGTGASSNRVVVIPTG